MPAKIARSAPRPPFGLPEVDGSRPNLASVLQEGRKNANIHASSGPHPVRENPGKLPV